MSRPSECFAFARRSLLLGSGATIALAGCSSLIGPTKAPQLYVLRPAMPQAGSLPPVAWQLSVAAPEASASLDSVRIALSRSSTTMDYFANAAWPDRVPLLMQSAIVEAFESTGKIAAVQRDASGVGANYLLAMELRAFEARYDGTTPSAKDAGGAPKAAITLACNLLAVPEHKVVQSRAFTHETPAARNDMDAIVTAFNEAVAATLQDVVEWTLRAPRVG